MQDLHGTQRDMGIDLHGKTVHTAWHEYRNVTYDCYLKKLKKITVITGHGVMSKEFPGWVSADPYATKCERQNPNTGAWVVHIKNITSQPVKVERSLDLTGLYKKFNK